MKLFSKMFKQTTYIDKLFFLFMMVVVVLFVGNTKKTVEGFSDEDEKFIIKKKEDIYDDFYSGVYDKLVFSDIKNNFEIGKIVNYTNPTVKSSILDVGSGTGHHVGKLNSLGYNTIGIDISPRMVAKSKENYPTSTFIIGDVMKSLAFNQNQFTHILCLYFTIYYLKNKRQFFDNCYSWLMPGGYLVLHLVDKNKFDTILPVGDVFTIVSPQKYADKRITSTVAKFNNYDYKSNFEFENDDNVNFIETFKNKNTGKIIKNIHELYMENQPTILSKARDAGFILVSKINMSKCQYNYQYLYILQKPS
jgi:SAM-dependent methyltransferase